MSEAAKKEKDPRTVTLKRVRLSFCEAWVEKKASSKENPDRKTFHGNVILETSGYGAEFTGENRAKIIAALEAAGEKEFKNKNKFRELTEDNPKRICYKKGERFKNQEGKIYTGYEGNFAFSTSGPKGGQKRPILKDKFKATLLLPDQEEVKGPSKRITIEQIDDYIYGGCYSDVIVSFYGTKKGSDGIFSTCELIRSHQMGERMGGGYVYNDDDLDEVDDFGDPEDDGFDDAPTTTKSEAKSQAAADDLF